MANEANILNLFTDSSLLMVSWLLLACSFHTWGGFFSKILGIQLEGNKRLFANIWLGWVFCVFFFAIYQLFWPINAFASSLFYFPGLIYFIFKYFKKIPEFIKNNSRVKFLVIILIAFAAAIIAVQPPFNYDTGFYHLPSIKWLNEYHIIKGLANLHSRFGFNQLYFLYSASLNFYPFFEEYAFHAVNSFLYVLFSAGCIMGGTGLDLLLMCLFFFLPMPYYWIGNPTPDMASTFLQIVAFRYFIEALRPSCGQKNCKPVSFIAFAAILSAAMVLVKLSNIIFALGLGAITIIFYRKNPLEFSENKSLKKSLIFIGIFTCVWMTRGYIQSGYPLFPSTIGKINFDWTVPEAYPKHQAECVYVGSRSLEQTFNPESPLLKNWNWFKPWFKYHFFDSEKYFTDDIFANIYVAIILLFFPITMFNWGIGTIVLSIISVILVVVWACKLRFNSELWKNTHYFFYLLIVELLSVCFWFFAAPVPRFANGIFIIFFATAFIMLKQAMTGFKLAVNLKKCIMFYPVIMLLWGFSTGCDTKIFKMDGMAILDKVETKIYSTNSGLKVEIPAKGSLCWIINVMSTPEPKPWLSLRTDSIEDGFCMKK